jgi:hypothetical protein
MWRPAQIRARRHSSSVGVRVSDIRRRHANEITEPVRAFDVSSPEIELKQSLHEIT